MPINSKSNKASSPLVKIQDVPDVPTIGTAVEGAEEALVAFTPAATGGKAALYRALSTPGSIEATGSASPILVPGLTAGTSYTFQVRGESAAGATTGYSDDSNSVVPEAGSAYELIESNILTSSASSVTFSSIPQDYKHLQIRMVTRTTQTNLADARDVYLRLNGVSSSSYSYHRLNGTGSSVQSGGAGNQAQIILPLATNATAAGTSIYSPAVIEILDYASTNKNTTVRALHGTTFTNRSQIALASGLFNNTAAVTSFTLSEENSTTWSAGSRFSLYGIRG